jgi:hypothetical protein
MIRLKAIVNGYAISKYPFMSWSQMLEELESKGVRVLRYRADPIPEVDRDGIIIKVHFDVTREKAPSEKPPRRTS